MMRIVYNKEKIVAVIKKRALRCKTKTEHIQIQA